jgi:hypothetical protein
MCTEGAMEKVYKTSKQDNIVQYFHWKYGRNYNIEAKISQYTG